MPKTTEAQGGKTKAAPKAKAKAKTTATTAATAAAGGAKKGKPKPKGSPKNKVGSGKKKSGKKTTGSPKNKVGSKSKTQAKGKGKGKAGTPKKKTAQRGAVGKTTAGSSSKKKQASPKGSKKKTTGTSPKAGSKTALRAKQLKQRFKQAKKPKLTRRKQTEERKRARIRNGILRREYLAARRAKAHSKFQIRCKKPFEDEIFDVDEFVKFLTERFKVNGKSGVVGNGKDATIQKSGTTIHVMSKQPFPKYYIKFLTKRYLKRNGLRDYVRVIADKKGSYELRYFNIQEEKEKSKKQEQ